MSRVYPRLYNRDLRYLGDLRTAKFGYKLKLTPLDTATITVPIEDAGQISMRQYVELFDEDKRVELFRVARIADKSYKQGGTCKFACDQVLCTLKDNLIPGYHEIGGVGMGLRACIEWVLARQAPMRWRLGRCDFDTRYQYSLEDSNLLVALLSLSEPLSDYMWSTDTTTVPWTLHLIRLTDDDASELRYRRNMTQIRETVDEDGFCTRLYPYGYGEGVNKLTIADVSGGVPYLDAPTQALYGVVEMPWTDATCTDATLLKARAEALLKDIQNPLTSFTVKALALSAITGEPLDRFAKGHMTRVVYTDYNIALRTRVVEIERPEVLGKPGDVTLTLSTAKADAATTIAELARKTQITELYSQGATTIDSDRLEVNCDKDHPAELEFFLARDYYRVNRVLIKIKLGRYRADSRAAKGGGGTQRTTSAGGGSTVTSSDGGGGTRTSTSGGATTVTTERTVTTTDAATWGPADGQGSSKIYTNPAEGNTGTSSPSTGNPSRSSTYDTASASNSAGGHDHSVSIGHYHKISNPGTSTVTLGASTYSFTTNSAGNHIHTGILHNHDMTHTHNVNSHSHSLGGHYHEYNHYHRVEVSLTIPAQSLKIPSHSHDVTIPAHSHRVTIDAHTHSVDVPDHTHAIDYGIFEGESVDEVSVSVDGNAVPAAAIVNSQVDVVPYLAKDGAGKITRETWHRVVVTPVPTAANPEGLCRITIYRHSQVFISGQAGGSY